MKVRPNGMHAENSAVLHKQCTHACMVRACFTSTARQLLFRC